MHAFSSLFSIRVIQEKKEPSFNFISNKIICWHKKKLRALSLMVCSLFLSVLLCSPAWLAVYCENLQIHWFETMAVLLLSSKNLEFCASHSQFGTSREKNFVFLPRCAKLTVLSTKLKVFWWEKQNCHSCKSMNL